MPIDFIQWFGMSQMLIALSLCRLYESQVKKIVKIQAVLRAVMTKIHKKRGILKPGTKQPKKAKDLTQNEAATIIQTSKKFFQYLPI